MRYAIGDVVYTREVFVSHPDQVMVVRLTASRPRSLTFTAKLGSRLHFRTIAADEALVLKGKAPAHVDPSYYNRPNPIVYAPDEEHGEGMLFQCRLRAIVDEGKTLLNDDSLRVEGASTVTLLLSAATSFNGFDRSPGRDGKDPGPIAAGRLAGAAGKSYEDLLQHHIADHQRLFRRVSLDLGPSPEEARKLPTDQRVRKFGADDPGLVALHFQYGRYLLIASSRPGTQPPNLQGIWNDEVRAPWSSNWTININTEMNMWPAEVTNLAECHAPLFDLIRGLSVNGRKTARINYGCGGWVSHHNADVWCQSAPVGDFGQGDSTWALWPMSGPWLCQHLWQHYEFGGDETFLRDTAYPLMKGAAEFCLDFLIDDGKGRLVTAPSTSPENQFVTPDGKHSAVSMASSMDLELIHDLFTHCIAASKTLGIDEPFRSRLEAALAKLYPLQIGSRRPLAGVVPAVRRDRGASPSPVSPLGPLSRQPDQPGHAAPAGRRPQVARGSQRRGNRLVLRLEDQPLGPSGRWRPRPQADPPHPPPRARRRLSESLRQPPPVPDGRQLRLPRRRRRDARAKPRRGGRDPPPSSLAQGLADGIGEGPARPGGVRGGYRVEGREAELGDDPFEARTQGDASVF